MYPLMLLMGSCVFLQEQAGSARPDSTVFAETQSVASSISSVPEEGGQLTCQLVWLLLPGMRQADCSCGLPSLC